MIKSLIKIAQRLDNLGLTKEADELDIIIKRIAADQATKKTKMQSFADDISKLQLGQGLGYRVTLDSKGLAAVRASSDYQSNPAAALQREMEKMLADPARRAAAITVALEKRYGLPHGRYGTDASKPDYFEKVKRDPEAVKILSE